MTSISLLLFSESAKGQEEKSPPIFLILIPEDKNLFFFQIRREGIIIAATVHCARMILQVEGVTQIARLPRALRGGPIEKWSEFYKCFLLILAGMTCGQTPSCG